MMYRRFFNIIGDTEWKASMPRTIYAHKLRNRTNRLTLEPRKKPYKVQLAPSVHLAYRRNACGPGTWSVLSKAGLERFALADDHEVANGSTVMSYLEAAKHALFIVRGSGEKTATVAQALDQFETNLASRGRNKRNVDGPRKHLPASLMNKQVSQLTESELADWRDSIMEEAGLTLGSANRIAKSLKAALALAARRDSRITNTNAWRNGLKVKRIAGQSNPPRDNFYIPDDVVSAIVRECTAIDADFGAKIAVLAQTGTRESQALRIKGVDIRDENPNAPKLMIWCSHKGKERDPEQRAVPITPSLARMLRQRAATRGNRPLLDHQWDTAARFRDVLVRLGLDPTLSPYVLRHASIIRQIRAGTPLQLIANAHDTSVAQIESTYSRFILNHASDDLRAGLLVDPQPQDNVVSLAR
jgi:integrase